MRTTGITYPGSTERISAVRADLRWVLRDCPMAGDVILCASELAANAVLHSRTGLPGGTFTVLTMINPGHCARIEVQDNAGPWLPASTDRTQHYGLDIVCTLASEWGITDDGSARTVWARFDWPG